MTSKRKFHCDMQVHIHQTVGPGSHPCVATTVHKRSRWLCEVGVAVVPCGQPPWCATNAAGESGMAVVVEPVGVGAEVPGDFCRGSRVECGNGVRCRNRSSSQCNCQGASGMGTAGTATATTAGAPRLGAAGEVEATAVSRAREEVAVAVACTTEMATPGECLVPYHLQPPSDISFRGTCTHSCVSITSHSMSWLVAWRFSIR